MFPPIITFHIIEESDGFRSLEQPWNALCGRLEKPHLFSSFDWCWNAWTRVAEGRGYRLRLVCGWYEGRLVLIWPMMEGSGVLRMLSSETLEYRDIIVEPSEHAARWIDGAWKHVLGTTRATTFIFQNLRLPNVLAARLERMPSAQRIGGGWCPLVRLDRFADWDAYASTLPKSLISDQRRQWKRLHHALPGVSFRLVDEVDMIEPVMAWVGRHKVAWGEARGGRQVWFDAEDIRALLQSVARRALNDGRLVLATLSDGTTTVSAGWGYVCGSEFLFHAFAYDSAYASYSPSRLFLESILRHCFGKGIRSFDFMPGEEAYKRIWATDYVATESYIGSLNWRGALWLALSKVQVEFLSVALRRLYRKFPIRWKGAIQRRLRLYRMVNHALTLKPVAKPRSNPTEPGS
jgi:CelD/BcsL family acetyltransferase involved in cellulose biosynthesis